MTDSRCCYYAYQKISCQSSQCCDSWTLDVKIPQTLTAAIDTACRCRMSETHGSQGLADLWNSSFSLLWIFTVFYPSPASACWTLLHSLYFQFLLLLSQLLSVTFALLVFAMAAVMAATPGPQLPFCFAVSTVSVATIQMSQPLLSSPQLSLLQLCCCLSCCCYSCSPSHSAVTTIVTIIFMLLVESTQLTIIKSRLEKTTQGNERQMMPRDRKKIVKEYRLLSTCYLVQLEQSDLLVQLTSENEK